jgi:N-carbamoyl-L-amino-acid hydrolase
VDLPPHRYCASLDRHPSVPAGAVIALTLLNTLPAAQFIESLAAIFEHSPWIAQRCAALRPFDSRLDLLDAMRGVVVQASTQQQLALINAHPKLGARGRPRQQLTPASGAEQRRAGLDACSDEEFAHLERINSAYLDRFGIPFILAVRGHDPSSIIAQLQRRLEHDRDEEMRTAIHQIGLIASYRLADSVASPPEAEVRAMLERLRGCDPVALLTEWMRAAALTVSSDGNGTVIGTLKSHAGNAGSLIVGLHQDEAGGSLIYDGQLGWCCALAVVQHLKEQGCRLPYDLAIVARARDPARGSVCALVGLDPGRTIALSQIGTHPEDRRPIAQALTKAQLARAQVPLLASAAAVADSDATLVRATRALEQFLLHTDCHG